MLLHKFCTMKCAYLLLIFCFLVPQTGWSQEYFDVDQSVKMTASADPESIVVEWVADPRTVSYDLYRREYGAAGWGEKLAAYPPSVTSYVDNSVQPHSLYEYKIEKFTEEDADGFGYVLSGYQLPPTHHSGDLLILLSPTTLAEVAPELDDYRSVLESDGWTTRTLLIDAESPVAAIKAAILTAVTEAPATALLLLDDVPVAYSGNINPDAHADHKGAWGSDVYYGDLDGVWTDTLVNNVTSATPVNHNIPGDGKWDQSYLPSDVELAVGRVDFRNLPFLTAGRYELLRRYLLKDLAYRTKTFTPRRRAAMRNQNPWLGALGQNGIRNFSPLVGPENIAYDTWTEVFDSSYLWYYGAGGNNVRNGQSWVFNTIDFQAVFTLWFSSYVGDYGLENNFMKAALGSGTVLTAGWAGAPHWHLHSMGMGYPIGYATVQSQNNDTIYTADYFPRGVHVNLLGDPTLKGYVVAPPNALIAVEQDGKIDLSWLPSPEAQDGYYVYRRLENEPYSLIDSTEANTLFYRDDNPVIGEPNEYLVRAAKLETTPSGSFVNLSAGTTASILPEGDGTATTALSTTAALRVYPNPAAERVTVTYPAGISHVQLTTMNGRLLYNKFLSGEPLTEISLSGIPAGTYLLIIRDPAGKLARQLLIKR